MQDISLIITDNKIISANMNTVFKFIQKDVTFADSEEEAKNELQGNNRILMAFVSLSEERAEEEILALLRSSYPKISVHIIDTSEKNSSRLKIPAGAASYLRFPVDFESLMHTIKKAEISRNNLDSRRGLPISLTGNSEEIQEVESLIRQVSQADANVLLLGESGTGKEIVARAIHQFSMRADGPFIAVNCGAIPPELLESELFGHEKGAFTGATNSRRGRFELAEGGTLFLDEIGDMPMPMQVKLLRVIQERTFERVGGMKTIASNVRLIAATHQDLEQRIAEGEFRTDLYYRLNVFPIKLPALRNRTSDIPLLLKEFSEKICLQLGKSTAIAFDDSAIEALSQHPLPGNVREVENLVERLSILRPGETISADLLPPKYKSLLVSPGRTQHFVQRPNIEPRAPSIKFDSGTIDLKQHLSALEKNLIFQALDDTDWVVSKAARVLTLRRTTLIQKIRKLGIRSENRQAHAISA
ncbi:MAG: sigma-54-dependent Fis family transcriptional regulator [Gammaproteobacteria bacterium]|nr:sigma-54-dependent Fis family transcriptional regulator [Gammaproteobacteria bacterium]